MKHCLPLLFATGLTLAAEADEISPTTIFHQADASESTKWATAELHRLVFAATGEDLPVVSEATSKPTFRLVSDDSLPHDGFVIRGEKGDIIIAGNESTPQGTWALPSHGTLWGVCEFAERFLGVRWLFPGPLGEDVPKQKALSFELKEPIRGQPGFAVRSVAYLGESDREIASRYVPVLDWMKHQRLTNSLHPFVTGYGHSWDDYIKPADMEAHPEWNSNNGEAVRNGRVKFFCTTAPGLVELFAKRVIETMDRNPKREMSSISPTDGGGFCTCERCKPLLDTDPHGKPSHARAMLTFYQRVGEIIARERPGRRLGGFVYYNYQYPPSNAPKLPDNLSLCWAPLNYYGYGLLKPLYRAEFESVMKRWSEITPHLFYHNYSTWMRSFHGAPLPVSLDILKRELPAAAQNKAWGARMVGTSAWGINAPINYLLAKQMWNPQLDVSAALNEWLERAYGPGWRNMRALYDELDAKMAAHKEAQSPIYKGANYEVNEEVMKIIYAPLFATMEQHYRAALTECATDTQRARLQMFGDNLIQLNHALRQAKLIAENPTSIFHRDDAAFAQFMKDMGSTFSLYRDKLGLDHGPIWKGEWSAP
ncbi:MAG: DUF4838 domain-containing protein [Verrucomicrobiaceae bacterium]|nr:DUF4838 domain-containing protein [Verrucomicrobiaceae bacterium]